MTAAAFSFLFSVGLADVLWLWFTPPALLRPASRPWTPPVLAKRQVLSPRWRVCLDLGHAIGSQLQPQWRLRASSDRHDGRGSFYRIAELTMVGGVGHFREVPAVSL